MQVAVQLDCGHSSGALQQQNREVPRPGPDLKHVVCRKQLGGVDDAPERVAVHEQVLAKSLLKDSASLGPHPAGAHPRRGQRSALVEPGHCNSARSPHRAPGLAAVWGRHALSAHGSDGCGSAPQFPGVAAGATRRPWQSPTMGATTGGCFWPLAGSRCSAAPSLGGRPQARREPAPGALLEARCRREEIRACLSLRGTTAASVVARCLDSCPPPSASAQLLRGASVVGVAEAARLASSESPPSLVAITGAAVPGRAHKSNDSNGSGAENALQGTLSVRTSSGERSGVLVLEAESLLHITEMKPGKQAPNNQQAGRRLHGRRVNNAHKEPAPSLVRTTEREATDRRSVPWGIEDSSGVAHVDAASMPAPPLTEIGRVSRMLGGGEDVLPQRETGDDLGALMLGKPAPQGSSTKVYTGREVVLRGLTTGTVLTVIGRAWVDSSGQLRLLAEGGMPAAVTTTSLPAMAASWEQAAWVASAVCVGLCCAGLGLAGFGVGSLWRAAHRRREEEEMGPRAAAAVSLAGV